WGVRWNLYFIEGTTEGCVRSTPTHNLTELGLCSLPDKKNPLLSKNRLADTLYNDVQVSYTYQPANMTFILGVNNLFNREPPVSYSSNPNYDPTLYRLPGRFVYGQIRVTF